ncbi:uncharacterized protein LOC120039826 isoform X1 [Salvelinus namaycush]|uniref:Uncharacterized protein LOC120039826 isoform X1 n=1 Tax=Salvelinus namaycush TaxID=8040 RepID=A0A8U0U6S9_SALNM|nr:uncharacterized protein LOC120039826 isoform X1 [Salvelinus namaycush]XP_038841124.1 uncharacterized protein LOC120039826 isoform X1 [Salvelinus namaycush]
MRGVVLLFLLSLWPGGQVDAINQEVLANVVQEMRRFGLVGQQYAMAVILTQDQCNQNQVKFDLNTEEIQNTLNGNNIYTGDWLIAATPLKTPLYTEHAEYRLLSRGKTKISPMETLINKAGHNAGQCIVFFSTYSPCLEKCNGPDGGRYNIIPLMNVFQGFDNNRKAFVFSSVWDPSRNHPGVTNPSRQWVLESFKRIDGHLPVYRCDRFKENNKWVNRCYRCVTANTNPDTNDCLYGY